MTSAKDADESFEVLGWWHGQQQATVGHILMRVSWKSFVFWFSWDGQLRWSGHVSRMFHEKWRGKSCWLLHPRDSCPGSSKNVITSPALLGLLVLVWSQQNYLRFLLSLRYFHPKASGPATLPREEAGVKMNGWFYLSDTSKSSKVNLANTSFQTDKSIERQWKRFKSQSAFAQHGVNATLFNLTLRATELPQPYDLI